MAFIDSYAALPLGKWEAIQRVAQDVTLEEVDRQAEVLGILSGSNAAAVLRLPIGEYAELARRAAFLNEPLSADAAPAMLPKFYRVGGWRLVPVTDIRKLTAAQYIDFQELAKEWQEHVAEVLSCFLVPDGKSYNEGYDIAEVQAAIREGLAVETAFGLLAFFLGAFGRSTLGILNSSAAELERERKRRAGRR